MNQSKCSDMSTYEAYQLYKRGDFNSALDKLKEKNATLTYEDHIIIGKSFLKKNLIKKALAEFELCKKIDPKKKEAYLQQALYYLNSGEKQKEFDVLSEGLLNNRNSKDFYYYLALYYYDKKEYENANKNLIELFQGNLSETSLTEKDFKILNAKVCYALNDKEPLKKLRNEMKNSNEHEYHFTLYQIYKNEYDYKNAKEEIKKAIDKINSKKNIIDKTKLKYICHQISIDYYLQNYESVIKKFTQLLNESNCGKFTTTIYFYLASSYRHLENIIKYKEYIDLYQQNNGIENEEYCLEKALFAISNNKDEECENWIKKSLEINDKYIPTIYFKIHYLISKERKEESSKLKNQYKKEIIQYIEKGSPNFSQSKSSNINSIYTSFDMNIVDTTTFPELSKTISNQNNIRPVKAEISSPSNKREIISKGGFGKVYLETNAKGQRVVKQIILKGDNIQEMKEKVKEEAFLLCGLNHKNIIKIKGYDEDNDEIFMEYAEGGDLDKLLESNKKLPVDFRIHLIQEIAEGLSYIHKKEIIHADLKPKNILLFTKYKEGESYPTPKICDFGLSSNQNKIKGHTPRYAPPELLDGKGELSFKSDIFSFGMTIYHILKRKKPFYKYKGDDADQLIKKGEIPDLNGISPDFASIIKKTLSFDPSNRPSIEEVLTNIKKCRSFIN